MEFKQRINYWRRVITAYRRGANSQLTFWHEVPAINKDMDFKDPSTGYYMTFYDKTLYTGPFDDKGVPMLDYKGVIGRQYNPIAIAQYGLGFYNRYVKEKKEEYLNKFLTQCNWLVDNLEENKYGLYVWMHHFDWEYFRVLKSPWYSSLSQGVGISSLIRGYLVTNDHKYLDAARLAFESSKKDIFNGGVIFIDKDKNVWFEEAITNPPTHILNGFIWSLWGVYDYYLFNNDIAAKKLFENAVNTIKNNLSRYDVSYWSLYGLVPTKLRMVASPFYHLLHIIQLRIMYLITGDEIFLQFSKKWDNYNKSFFIRSRSLMEKMLFKIFYF